jgi:glyoxylase-like metal-dependent hydrolase (beta-lactamase superfamily II)
MSKKLHIKLILSMIIITMLIVPTLSVSAKKYREDGSIPAYPVTDKVIRFEETIPLSEDAVGYPGFSYRVNVYGVDVGKGVILIDSGDDDLASELYKSVTKAFNKPIIAVYLTHYHADHAGGGAYLQSMGIPVYAPVDEMYFIMQGANLQPGTPIDFTYTGYVPDYTYEESDLYNRFEAIPEPGHTMGAVSIEYRHGNTMYLFTADTILPMTTDDVNEGDMTSDLTIGTAYNNYLYANNLYTTQLSTLNGMLYTVSDYDYVLTGHINPMSSEMANGYIQYTIETLLYFSYI